MSLGDWKTHLTGFFCSKGWIDFCLFGRESSGWFPISGCFQSGISVWKIIWKRCHDLFFQPLCGWWKLGRQRQSGAINAMGRCGIDARWDSWLCKKNPVSFYTISLYQVRFQPKLFNTLDELRMWKYPPHSLDYTNLLSRPTTVRCFFCWQGFCVTESVPGNRLKSSFQSGTTRGHRLESEGFECQVIIGNLSLKHGMLTRSELELNLGWNLFWRINIRAFLLSLRIHIGRQIVGILNDEVVLRYCFYC